jgi:hypothetical protein
LKFFAIPIRFLKSSGQKRRGQTPKELNIIWYVASRDQYVTFKTPSYLKSTLFKKSIHPNKYATKTMNLNFRGSGMCSLSPTANPALKSLEHKPIQIEKYEIERKIEAIQPTF